MAYSSSQCPEPGVFFAEVLSSLVHPESDPQSRGVVHRNMTVGDLIRIDAFENVYCVRPLVLHLLSHSLPDHDGPMIQRIAETVLTSSVPQNGCATTAPRPDILLFHSTSENRTFSVL